MIRFCSLVSGSSGNALYLEHGRTKILIDCGISCLKICTALKEIGVEPSEIRGIVVTHEHSDHVSGVKVFSNKFGCRVYGSRGTLDNITAFGESVVEADKPFEIGDIVISPFDIPHDGAQPFGYSFFVGNKKLSVATDMGKIDKNVAERIKNSNLAFIEANHDIKMLEEGPYPFYLKERVRGKNGHLSNEQCASLAAALARTGTENIILGHLSNTNNTPEIARKTVENALKEEGIIPDKDVFVDVAERYSIGSIYSL